MFSIFLTSGHCPVSGQLSSNIFLGGWFPAKNNKWKGAEPFDRAQPAGLVAATTGRQRWHPNCLVRPRGLGNDGGWRSWRMVSHEDHLGRCAGQEEGRILDRIQNFRQCLVSFQMWVPLFPQGFACLAVLLVWNL